MSKSTNRFTIVTPVYIAGEYRKRTLKRAIESVANQTFKGKFEHLIINDGSPEWTDLPDYPFLKVINKQHENRIQGYETGFKKAKGEIICILDSDDEYAPNYLERVDGYFRDYPFYKLFNFGCVYRHEDGTETTRDAFKPEKLDIGHEVFGGGNIVNGTFVFHRDVYSDLGAFPPNIIKDIDCTELNYGKEQPRDLFTWSPYDLSAWFQMEFPEQRQYFMVNHEAEPEKIIKEIGNPFGNDHILFYKFTRKYHSMPIDDYLYIVHPKSDEHEHD